MSLLKAFSGHPVHPAVVLALGAGLRPSEAYAVKWSDIDLAAKEVTIRRGLHERDGENWFERLKAAVLKTASVRPILGSKPGFMESVRRH